MKTTSRVSFLVCLIWMTAACSPSSATQNPVVDTPGQGPVTATDAPVAQDPTSTTAAPVDADLSESEVLGIVRSSLAAYPWRLEQIVAVKETGQTSTSLTEAQSSTRGYNKSVQTLGAETITIETTVIDSTVYLKIAGSPAETYGLVDGQWTEVQSDSPLSQFVDRGAIDPAKIAEIFATDFASMPKDAGISELLFTMVGSEEVNSIPTSIYESKGTTFTYRWWIGADGRFYKTTVELPQATRTMLIEYDADIDIQPPVP